MSESPKKEPLQTENGYDDVSETSEMRGTRADMASMWRMGKTQELLRNFRFVSIFGFSMILMASWETMLGYILLTSLRDRPMLS